MMENIENITHPVQASKQFGSTPGTEAVFLFPVSQSHSFIEAIAQDGSK